MTNREWLETLSDEMLASEISTRCGLCAKRSNPQRFFVCRCGVIVPLGDGHRLIAFSMAGRQPDKDIKSKNKTML